jgi:hypothetical protein
MFFPSQRVAKYAMHTAQYGPNILKALFSGVAKPCLEIFIRVNKNPSTTYKIEGSKPFDGQQAWDIINPIQNLLIGSTPEGAKLTRSVYTDDGLVEKVLAGPGIEWTDTGDTN